MGLAGVEVLFTVPLATYVFVIDLTSGPLSPYVNWSYAHNDFGLVQQFPSIVWQQDQAMVVGIELTRYLPVFCALVFFAFFGFADEARRNYRLAYMSVAKRVGLSTGLMSATGTWTANGYVDNLNSHLTLGGPNSRMFYQQH